MTQKTSVWVVDEKVVAIARGPASVAHLGDHHEIDAPDDARVGDFVVIDGTVQYQPRPFSMFNRSV